MQHNVLSLEQWNRNLNLRFTHELGESPRSRFLMVIKSAINKGRVALERLATPRILPMSLEQTLSDLKDEFSPADGVQLRIFVTGTPRELRPAVREQLHRLGREVLINALRHSKATRVEAEVQYLPGRLRLVMRDNGCGLDPQRHPVEEGDPLGPGGDEGAGRRHRSAAKDLEQVGSGYGSGNLRSRRCCPSSA